MKMLVRNMAQELTQDEYAAINRVWAAGRDALLALPNATPGSEIQRQVLLAHETLNRVLDEWRKIGSVQV